MADTPSNKRGGTRVHVLTLSEQSAHVRALARSWAAGEVSMDDYRTIRALTIEGMLNGEFANGAPDAADTTASPHDAEDHDITAVGDRTGAEGDDTEVNPDAPIEATRPMDASSLPRVALIAGAVLLVLGVILLFTLS